MFAGMPTAANDNEHVPPLTSEQLTDIDRRVAALDAGAMTCEPWEIVMQRLLGDLSGR